MLAALGGVAALALGAGAAPAEAQAVNPVRTSTEIEAGVDAALMELFQARPDTRQLFSDSRAVLVFPEIVKAGLIVGGSYGEGALLMRGKTQSYWSYAAASLGFQLGAQKIRFALFFMTDEAIDAFLASEIEGFEFGADVELTVVDEGGELGADTTVANASVIAIAFSRQGLLGGVSLAGGKYTRIER